MSGEPLPEEETTTEVQTAKVSFSGGGRAVELEGNFTDLETAAEIAYKYWSKMDPGPGRHVGFGAEGPANGVIDTRIPFLGSGSFEHDLNVEVKNDDRTK